MPVNYVAPGPIAYRRSIYGAGDGMGGGGGGGGGGRAFYGPGPIVQLQDRTGEFQNRLNLASIDATVQTNLADQRFAQQSVLARQASELNAWEFQQRVTTQESAQERADRNAIVAVDADPTMTEEEKVQAKTRIKSRIDWVSERAKRDGAQAEAQMMQSRAKMFQSEVEQNEQMLQFATAAINGKVKTIVDDDAAIEIGEAFEDAFPGLKQRDPAEFGRMVEKEAILQGRATRYMVNEKSVVDLSKGQRFGEGGQLSRSGAGGTGGGADRQQGSSGSRSGTRVGDPIEQADKGFSSDVELAIKALSGGATPPSPESVMEFAKKLQAARGEATAGARARTPEGRMESLRAQHEQSIAEIDTRLQMLKNDTASPPGLKTEALKALGEVKRLLAKYPPERRPPEAIRKKIANQQQYADQLIQTAKIENLKRDLKAVVPFRVGESPPSGGDAAFENMAEGFPMG